VESNVRAAVITWVAARFAVLAVVAFAAFFALALAAHAASGDLAWQR